MMRIDGAIFFGAVDHVQNQLLHVDAKNPLQKHLLLVSKGINFVDAANAELLGQEAIRRRKMDGGLYFLRCNEQVIKCLEKSHKIEDIGKDAFFNTMENWVAPIYVKLNNEICRNA